MSKKNKLMLFICLVLIMVLGIISILLKKDANEVAPREYILKINEQVTNFNKVAKKHTKGTIVDPTKVQKNYQIAKQNIEKLKLKKSIKGNDKEELLSYYRYSIEYLKIMSNNKKEKIAYGRAAFYDFYTEKERFENKTKFLLNKYKK